MTNFLYYLSVLVAEEQV